MTRTDEEKTIVADLIEQIRTGGDFNTAFENFTKRRENLLSLGAYSMLLTAMLHELQIQLGSSVAAPASRA